MVTVIRMNRDMQRNLLMVNLLYAVAVIWLFNLFWEPVCFMLVASYVIMNDRKLKANELLLLGAVKILLIYSIIARLFGMNAGLFISSFLILLLIIIYGEIWRKSK